MYSYVYIYMYIYIYIWIYDVCIYIYICQYVYIHIWSIYIHVSYVTLQCCKTMFKKKKKHPHPISHLLCNFATQGPAVLCHARLPRELLSHRVQTVRQAWDGGTQVGCTSIPRVPKNVPKKCPKKCVPSMCFCQWWLSSWFIMFLS